MAGDRQATSSDAEGKESLQDKDVGAGFLSSWKTMSLSEDDTMDFSFATEPKGKKSYNFETLDVDFNLDSDFGKLSSFRMDMPDLDFLNPTTTTAKLEEKSSGKFRPKKDAFSFSFDFNGIDDFDLDSSLVKKGKSSNQSLDDNQAFLDKETVQGSKVPVAENDDKSKILDGAALQIVNNSKVETVKDSPVSCKAKGLPLESPSRVNHVTGVEETYSLEMKNKKSLSKSCQIFQDVSRPSVSGNAKNDNTPTSELEVSAEKSDNTVKTISVEPVKENNEQTKAFVVSYATFEKRINPPEEVDTDSPVHIKKQIQSARCDLGAKNASTDLFLETKQQDTSEDILSSSAMPPFDEIGSQESSGKIEAMLEKESEPIRSKYFKKPEEADFLFRSTPTSEPATLIGGSKSDDFNVGLAYDKSANDGTTGGNITTGARTHVAVLPRAGTASVETSKRGIRDGGGKAVEGGVDEMSSRQDNKIEGKNTVEKEKDSDSGPIRIPAEKASTPSTSRVKPLLKSRISIERSEVSKSLSGLSINETHRPIIAVKGTSSLSPMDVVSSFRNSKQTMGQANESPKVSPLGGRRESHMLQTSLKRKTLEILKSNTEYSSLKPPKRLFASPSNIAFISSEEKVCSKENRAETKAKGIICSPTAALQASANENTAAIADVKSSTGTLCVSASALAASSRENTKGKDMPSTMENYDNIEKAEMYMKELENISNILKKKHEEAKEVLVRAIVNNNYLLMLNHPIYEEKVLKLEKLAAKLMPKELEMPQTRGAFN